MSWRFVERRTLKFIKRHDLFSAGDRLIVALSGGPDSVCLLHILYTLCKVLSVTLHAAHLDHSLRGTESEQDCLYVSSLAQRLSIPLTVRKVDVAQHRKERGLTLEEAARELRYAFLAEVLNAEKGTSVVTGHTRDDQVETILMNILRGSGTRGLRGLQSKVLLQAAGCDRPITVIRPLLPLSRTDTAEYCRRHGLSPRSDSTNQSLNFLRNRVRLELIPFLRSYNSKIDESLLRLAVLSDDDHHFIEEQGEKTWNLIAQTTEAGLFLDLKLLSKLPKALQRNTMANALRHMRGDLYDIEFTHIESMVELIEKPAGRSVHLPEGLVLIKEYERLVLVKNLKDTCPYPLLAEDCSIEVPGRYVLNGWTIVTQIADTSNENSREDVYTAQFDLARTGTTLKVRKRKAGDRFYPLGMCFAKKLQDFMVDVKIPRTWRDRVPLLCAGDEIIWVVGARIDERFKVTCATEQVLTVRFERPCKCA